MRVLVTGASTGIGRATAEELERRGHTVHAGTRDWLDVTSAADIAAAVERVGPLDALVNNAGIAVTTPVEHAPLDQLRRQLEVNVVAQIAVTQAFLPALRSAGGRIVNLSSISGRMALPLYGPYAASKYALEALSDSLRRELRGSGVRVILIEPGAIRTPIWRKGVADADAIWEGMPAEARERYGTLQQKIRGFAERAAEEADPPETVARVIADALETPRPRTRYLIGRDARIQAALARVLPDRALDAVLDFAIRHR
jgi:NAD(P)-dependent dehydrogenase (short-subunit alcohol dehydrogenase family)